MGRDYYDEVREILADWFKECQSAGDIKDDVDTILEAIKADS